MFLDWDVPASKVALQMFFGCLHPAGLSFETPLLFSTTVTNIEHFNGKDQTIVKDAWWQSLSSVELFVCLCIFILHVLPLSYQCFSFPFPFLCICSSSTKRSPCEMIIKAKKNKIGKGNNNWDVKWCCILVWLTWSIYVHKETFEKYAGSMCTNKEWGSSVSSLSVVLWTDIVLELTVYRSNE